MEANLPTNLECQIRANSIHTSKGHGVAISYNNEAMLTSKEALLPYKAL